jgi:membrane associated rhomboid family serine protease
MIMMQHDSRPISAAGRLPGASLLLSILAVLLYYFPGAGELLEYSRPALAQGEIWRLVSCHWTHWSGEHLLWDVVAFGVLAALCEKQFGRRLLVTSLASAAVAIPLVCMRAACLASKVVRLGGDGRPNGRALYRPCRSSR